MLYSQRLIIYNINYQNKDDLEELFKWQNDVKVINYIYHHPFLNKEEFEKYIYNQLEQGQQIYIGKLNNAQSNDIICFCRFYNEQIIYACNPKYRKNGYMAEFLQILIGKLQLDNIIAYVDKRNEASQKLLLKLGFKQEPIRRFLSNTIIYKYVYSKTYV